jgi:hypothetical protein
MLLPNSVAWDGIEPEEERSRTSKRKAIRAFRDAVIRAGTAHVELQNRCTATVLTRHADDANAV